MLSVDGDAMRIRWDTGEEASTSVALQAKILANMNRELNDAAARKRGAVPNAFGEFFRGLQLADFADDVTGTHWRSREQLGGAVTKLLDVREPYNSWSIYGRPEIHWASVSRYRLHHPSLQAKFFAKANTVEILVGLYIGGRISRRTIRTIGLSLRRGLRNRSMPPGCTRHSAAPDR